MFGRPLPGFRSVADPRSSASLQIAFTETNPLNPFPGILQQFITNKLEGRGWTGGERVDWRGEDGLEGRGWTGGEGVDWRKGVD